MDDLHPYHIRPTNALPCCACSSVCYAVCVDLHISTRHCGASDPSLSHNGTDVSLNCRPRRRPCRLVALWRRPKVAQTSLFVTVRGPWDPVIINNGDHSQVFDTVVIVHCTMYNDSRINATGWEKRPIAS